jgi:putative transposase
VKKSRFTDEQIAFALKQQELSTPVEEICRIAQATFFNWKKRFAGLGASELRRLRQLEDENTKLKKLVADLSLDKIMLQDVVKRSRKTLPLRSSKTGTGSRSRKTLPLRSSKTVQDQSDGPIASAPNRLYGLPRKCKSDLR